MNKFIEPHRRQLDGHVFVYVNEITDKGLVTQFIGHIEGENFIHSSNYEKCRERGMPDIEFIVNQY